MYKVAALLIPSLCFFADPFGRIRLLPGRRRNTMKPTHDCQDKDILSIWLSNTAKASYKLRLNLKAQSHQNVIYLVNLKEFNRAALLDFPNVIGSNESNSDSETNLFLGVEMLKIMCPPIYRYVFTHISL